MRWQERQQIYFCLKEVMHGKQPAASNKGNKIKGKQALDKISKAFVTKSDINN